MGEEDAFWAWVGVAKAFNNVFVFDFREPKDKISTQYEYYNPVISRKVAYKNEMNILTCLVKLHFP